MNDIIRAIFGGCCSIWLIFFIATMIFFHVASKNAPSVNESRNLDDSWG